MAPTTEPRVLLVDDDADIRLLTRTRLEVAGAVVVGEATNADSGVALAQTEQPDLIVLDERMPGRPGSQAIPDFRRAAPAARIVLYTALPPDAVHNDGADCYVEKTAPMRDLLRACLP